MDELELINDARYEGKPFRIVGEDGHILTDAELGRIVGRYASWGQEPSVDDFLFDADGEVYFYRPCSDPYEQSVFYMGGGVHVIPRASAEEVTDE